MPAPTLRRLPTLAVVDGPALFGASRQLGWDVDYRRLREHMEDRCGDRLRLLYVAAVPSDDSHSPVVPLVRFLANNGWEVRAKQLREWTEPDGRKRQAANLLVDVAVAMMEADWAEQVALFSGAGDLAPAVAAVQRRGTRVVVASTARTDPPAAAEELRREADGFLELADLEEAIGKPLAAPRRG